jgi:hypothetical protein
MRICGLLVAGIIGGSGALACGARPRGSDDGRNVGGGSIDDTPSNSTCRDPSLDGHRRFFCSPSNSASSPRASQPGQCSGIESTDSRSRSRYSCFVTCTVDAEVSGPGRAEGPRPSSPFSSDRHQLQRDVRGQYRASHLVSPIPIEALHQPRAIRSAFSAAATSRICSPATPPRDSSWTPAARSGGRGLGLRAHVAVHPLPPAQRAGRRRSGR